MMICFLSFFFSCLRLFDAGIKAYREMETFEEAGVHNEKEDYSLKVQEDKKVKG